MGRSSTSGTLAVISFDKNLERPQSVDVTTSKWYCMRRFLDWFCGLDSSAVTTPTQVKTRLRDMTSLHQTRRARAALYTALFVLVTFDLFLYIFFSSGSDFGLLRNSGPDFEILPSNTTTTALPANFIAV